MNIPKICPICNNDIYEYMLADKTARYRCSNCNFIISFVNYKISFLSYILNNHSVLISSEKFYDNTDITWLYILKPFKIILKLTECVLPKSLKYNDLENLVNKLSELVIFS